MHLLAALLHACTQRWARARPQDAPRAAPHVCVCVTCMCVPASSRLAAPPAGRRGRGLCGGAHGRVHVHGAPAAGVCWGVTYDVSVPVGVRASRLRHHTRAAAAARGSAPPPLPSPAGGAADGAAAHDPAGGPVPGGGRGEGGHTHIFAPVRTPRPPPARPARPLHPRPRLLNQTLSLATPTGPALPVGVQRLLRLPAPGAPRPRRRAERVCAALSDARLRCARKGGRRQLLCACACMCRMRWHALSVFVPPALMLDSGAPAKVGGHTC